MSEEAGYSMESPKAEASPQTGGRGKTAKFLWAGSAGIFMLFWVLKLLFHIDFAQLVKDLYMLKYFSQLGTDPSYGLLLVLGFLTSFHCIGMCGGITLSQTIRYQNDDIKKSYAWLLPSALYNSGRVIAYTAVGAVVGGLGQVISFSGAWKGLIPILGGIFMIIMGINLLEIFPVLRRLNIPVPKWAAKKLLSNNAYSPFYVGLLTALMPCGPLQIVQLYALSTRSVVFGALSMFAFSLGTVPLLFSLGAINSLVTKSSINKVLKVSAVLVVVLGLVMLGRGLSLSGVVIHMPFMTHSDTDSSYPDAATARIEGHLQTVSTSIEPDAFTPIVVQKGIPVRWIIQVDADKLNECNRAIQIPGYKIEKDLSVGPNVVEFTPWETGELVYTCWMGMIKSKIIVVEDLNKIGSEI